MNRLPVLPLAPFALLNTVAFEAVDPLDEGDDEDEEEADSLTASSSFILVAQYSFDTESLAHTAFVKG